MTCVVVAHAHPVEAVDNSVRRDALGPNCAFWASDTHRGEKTNKQKHIKAGGGGEPGGIGKGM